MLSIEPELRYRMRLPLPATDRPTCEVMASCLIRWYSCGK
jgi:hypothetical protein